MGHNMNKEQALNLVKEQIALIRLSGSQRSFQSGYVNGLMAAFLHSGLITVSDFTELHDLLVAEIQVD